MEWLNTTERDWTINLDQLDPYAHWSLGEGLPYFLPAGEALKFIPVLIHLSDGVSPKDFADARKFLDSSEDRQRWRSAVYVPPAFTEFPPELDALHQIRHTAAIVTRDFFDIIRDPKYARARDAVRRITLSRPIRNRSYAFNMGPVSLPSKLKKATAGVAPNTVVVGILDDGIAFGHYRFRNAAGQTRIESIWIQDGDPPPPPGFAFGHEFTKAGISGPGQLVDQSTYAGFFDEDEFYRRAQVGDFTRPDHKPVTWRAAHGTAVLDLAAGAEPGMPPDWPIVCVQLPVFVTAQTSGAMLEHFAFAGIWYILLRSLAIAAQTSSTPLPVVINLSYGFIAGSHDGTRAFELAIDNIVQVWQSVFNVEVNIVIASGNNHLSRVHGQFGFSLPNDVAVAPWRIQPDDGTPSFVEVWLPTRASKFPSPIELSIITPDGLASPFVGSPASSSYQLISPSGGVLCEVGYYYVPAPTARGKFLITISPTAPLAATGVIVSPVAPSGTWTILLKNNSVAPAERVRAWIQRDDTPYGYRILGRQSYFDDPAYRRFDQAGREIEVDDPGTVIKGAGTINAIATGQIPAVIGGLLRKELRPAKYSSGGPLSGPTGLGSPYRDGPDALTISDDSRTLAGVLAAGTRSGSVVSWNGTSVAAPLITRFLADELAAGRPGGRLAVCNLATADESTPPLPPTSKPAPERGGCGRIRRPPLYPLRLR